MYKVDPQSNGVDDFVIDSLDLSGLSEGPHTLSVNALTVSGQPSPASGVTTTFIVSRTPPTLTIQSGQGALSHGAITADTWITITAQKTIAPVKSIEVYKDGGASPYKSVAAASLSGRFDGKAWYWVRACDTAINCVDQAFGIFGPNDTPPAAPPPPGAPPGGKRFPPPGYPPNQPPPTPQPPYPPPTPSPTQPACLTASANPATGTGSCLPTPPAPVPPGGPPKWCRRYPNGCPRPRYFVPHDPNQMFGPTGSVTPGQLMTYTIEFENEGQGTARGVYVTDTLHPALDETTLVLRDMFRVDFASNTQVSATFPWSFDPLTRTVTVLCGNAGFRNGGRFVLEARLRADAAQGTIINNQAIVYFPNALEATPTNTIVSAVPLPTQVAYEGASGGTYADTVELAARLRAGGNPVSRQTVNFELLGSTSSGITNASGVASSLAALLSPAGAYQVGVQYPGDGFYYLPSAASANFELGKRAVALGSPVAEARSTETARIVVSVTDDLERPLDHQNDEPKSIHLELLDDAGAATPLQSALVAGSSVQFDVALPQPLQLLWQLRARFDGDSHYAAVVSSGQLRLIDDLPPSVAIVSPQGGQTFSGAASIPIQYSVQDNADPAPFSAAFLVSADASQSVPVSNGGIVPASSLSSGFWRLRVDANDWAENAVSTTTGLFEVISDALPPRTSLSAGAPSFGANPVYVATATLLSLSAVDDSSTVGDELGVGVAQTQYAVDGGSYAVYASPFGLTGEGAHQVAFFSEDTAGHVESVQARGVVLDSIPPQTSLLINGLPISSGSVTALAGDYIGFSSTDAAAGVAQTRYALDASTAQAVFVSTFSLAAGTHTLTFFSVDRVDNAEASVSVFIDVLQPDATAPTLALIPAHGSTVTTATPELIALYSDDGRGVDAATARLFLDGLEVTSSATVTVSSTAFTPPVPLSQGTHTVTASVSDFAGNRASSTSTFLIDSLPPVTALLIDGIATGATALVLASTDTIGFSAVDGGVGVLETLYSVDGATEAVFVSTFTLSPGGHAIAFRSRDQASNLEATRAVSMTVTAPSSDTTPPLVRLEFPGAAALGVEQAVGGVVNVRGAASDASSLTWTLESAPGAAATDGFAAIASGAGSIAGLIAAWDTTSLEGYRTLRLRAVDAFGNAASATAVVFVGKPVFTFAIGRKDSHVIVNEIKNPTGIAVRSDGNIWVANTDDDRLLLLTPAGAVVAEVDGDRDHGHGHHGHGHGGGHDDDQDIGFKNPQGLALDSADNLYVADKGNDRILKLSPDGSQVLLQIAKVDGHGRSKPGSDTGELRKPWDVAVDGNGDIYAADSGNRRIQVFNSSGAYLRQFGQGVLLSTSEVRGIALTAEGLWVSDKEQERVFLFSRAGTLIKSIGDADSAVGEISRMRGLASDRLGALYVVEPNRDRTQKFDPQGKGLLAFGSKAGLSHADKHAKRYLTQPIDAAIAPDGSIWITDTGRDRIVRYALPVSGGYGTAAYSTGGDEIFSSESVEPARRVVDHKDGAKVERDDGVGVHVPKGALSADLEITVEKGDENEDKEQKEAKRKEKKVAAVSEEVQYGPEGTTFSTPVTLTIPYDPALLASRGIKEDSLKVYYWNPTLKDWEAMPSTLDKTAKTVSALTSHFSSYQIGGLGGIGVAAIDDFGLRDGYAFPNPSRGGASVTFRLQPGSVDSIEVRVYDVSGRKVHSSSDFRFLGAIDDGNGKGAQNTYDHVWDVSGIGSGVYTYVMTAKKAGQSDIRKTGKVGVIR